MANRKVRLLRRLVQEARYEKSLLERQQKAALGRQEVKALSKRQSKNKKQRKEQRRLPTNDHCWYKVRVIECAKKDEGATVAAPTKEFLLESFRTLLDTEFTIFGFHQSMHSAYFFLNNPETNKSIVALNNRMQGAAGHLIQISSKVSVDFLVLNPMQLATVQQVFLERYNTTTGVLDLSRFHYDPLFLTTDIFPVLGYGAILKQVLIIIRDNFPNLQGLDLSHNILRLQHMTTVANILSESKITRLNLEHNAVYDGEKLMNTVSVFPLIELKLEGNHFLKIITDSEEYIKTVQSKFPSLQTLDGVDIAEYLASRAVNAVASTPVTSSAFVSQDLMHEFLKEFYNALDSEHRLQLVNAFVPTAKFGIQSKVPAVPSGEISGHDGITEALKALPVSIHARDSFSLETEKCEPSEGQVKVSGQVQLNGQTCSFVHAFTIVPYNTGLGCSMCIFEFQ